MPHGMETVPMTETEEGRVDMAAMKLQRFSLGLMQVNRVQNAEVQRILGTSSLLEKARVNRLQWYGLVRRREETDVRQRHYQWCHQERGGGVDHIKDTWITSDRI